MPNALKTVLALIRKEVVVIAGLATGVLSFLVANDNVIAAIIPIVVSLITRTQVSPVAKLEELLKLLAELKARRTPMTTTSTPVAVIPVKPRPPDAQ